MRRVYDPSLNLSLTAFAPDWPRGYGPALPAPGIPRLPDIFDEVEEDLRAERARRMMRRYGGAVLAAVVVLIAAAAAYQYWRTGQERLAARAAAGFIAAMNTADGPESGRQGAVPGFAAIAAGDDRSYATLARLRLAALRADAGDLPAALALWDEVARDGGADPLLRDVANLRWATHQIDNGDPAAIRARLQPLLAPEDPFHGRAAEAMALLDLRQGDEPAARAALKRLTEDVTAPDGVRGRANGLLSRLGGAGS